jgi:hypothetical protein
VKNQVRNWKEIPSLQEVVLEHFGLTDTQEKEIYNAFFHTAIKLGDRVKGMSCFVGNLN